MNETVDYEPAPCDDCDSYDYCASNYTACTDFSIYVEDGTFVARNRTPYASIYNRVYSGREEF